MASLGLCSSSHTRCCYHSGKSCVVIRAPASVTGCCIIRASIYHAAQDPDSVSGWLAGGTCVLVQCWRPHKLVLPGTHSMLAPDVVVPCGGTQAGGFVAAGGALIPGRGIHRAWQSCK